MVDVSKISGPGSPQDPFSGKDPLKVNAEKFRKHVEETDTEQKKKQKKPKKDVEELEDEAEEVVSSRTPAQDRSILDIKFPKGPLIKEVGKTDEQQKKQEKRPEETPSLVKPIEQPPVAKKQSVQIEKQELLPPATSQKTDEQDVNIEGIAFSLQSVPPPIPKLLQPEEEKEKSVPLVPQPKKEEEKKPAASKEASPIPQASPGPLFLPPATGVSAGYFSMKPEVFQLFEHMVMAITVMNESGITETTIHLNSADFSLFAGAQIIIKEYSTAPKAFNIEFLGNAENSALFSSSAQDLVASINSGNYTFRINGIDSSLLSSQRPLFHRKEKPGEKGENFK